MEKVLYEEMLPHEIVARRRKFPAAFVGLGGLEWHGEHMAVGNDALKAEKLCELAAARSGGFAFPTLWYGEPRVAGLMESGYDQDGAIKKRMAFKDENFNDTKVFAGIEFHYPPETEDVGGDHAAKWETSYLWYLRPDCVDLSVYLGRDDEKLVGIMGDDPRRTATVEIGRKACDLIVEGMVRKANDLIQRAK